ncbi:MAG TPA: tetratricopeptide repeat protein [Desulfobulbus sp.]|nr:tetratricopeptide repeat protein [Desulfobulbus sp.]
MFLPQTGQWTTAVFPETVWSVDYNNGFLSRVLLLFAAVSGIYLLTIFLAARFASLRRKSLGTGLLSAYIITVVLICFSVAASANGAVYRPLFQVIALFLFHAGIIISLAGGWLVYVREAEDPAPLYAHVRGYYWFSLLTAPLLWLVIFLQVPVVAIRTHTIFWGPVTLALLCYFVLEWLMAEYGHHLCAMAVPPETLSEHQTKCFRMLKEFVAARGKYPLILLGTGFRNALALYPQMCIMVGLDLLSHLSEKEIQAVLLHEIGHLRDKRYVPCRHRLVQVLPFLMVAWVVPAQADLFANPLVSFGVLIFGLVGFSTVFKRLRLKGEFVADAFVKNSAPDLYPCLLSGIKRITRLNGTDQDFCKKHDHGHLDLDERREMVENGKFSIKRKRVRRFILTLVPFMVLGVLFQIGWSTLFPSAVSQWKTLHKRYHQQYNNHNYKQAAQTIHQSLDLSLQKIGEIDHHTYISLKDLAQCAFRQNNVAQAEQYILRAGRIGRELYGADNLHRMAEWRLLAAIRLHQHRKDEARRIYTSLESLQQQAGDSAYNHSRTLYSLAALAGSNDEKIGYYQKIVHLYRQSPPDATPSEDIFSLLAGMYMEAALPDRAEDLLTEAVRLIREKKGAAGNEYGNALYELATLLRDLKKYHEAKKVYTECMNMGPEIEEYIPIGCRYGLAESYRLQNMPDKAEHELRQALHLEENLYGRDSFKLAYGLKELAAVMKKQGNQELADQYLQRALQLEKTK